MDNVLIQATAAAMFVKVVVDLAKFASAQIAGWAVALLAFLFGQAAAFLLEMTTDAGLNYTQQDISGCILVGILASGTAIGVTELHKTARGQ